MEMGLRCQISILCTSKQQHCGNLIPIPNFRLQYRLPNGCNIFLWTPYQFQQMTCKLHSLPLSLSRQLVALLLGAGGERGGGWPECRQAASAAWVPPAPTKCRLVDLHLPSPTFMAATTEASQIRSGWGQPLCARGSPTMSIVVSLRTR